MEIKAFKWEYMDLFEWRDYDKEVYNVDSEFIQLLKAAEEYGMVMFHEGRILGIGGVVPISKTAGAGFMLFSKWADLHPKIAARTVRRMFASMVSSLGMVRVVTYNLVGAEEHNKWVEWLGFKKEGVARKFDEQGRDYVQWALIR